MLKRSLISALTALLCLFILTGTVYAIPLPPTGTITTENTFLIGQNAGDQVGSYVISLPNGNIVIASPEWNGRRGAVTCLTPAEYTGSTPIMISESNSLVGTLPNDDVGTNIFVLKNGHYVVISPMWDNGATANVGAVTWVTGETCHPVARWSASATR
jgi:hypothetical protein